MNHLELEVFRYLQESRLEAYRRAPYFVRCPGGLDFYGWINSASELLPGRDFTVDDIVQHVILKTINGERKWDPQKGLLFLWLKYQVKSVMDACGIKGEFGKHEVSFGDDEVDEEAARKNQRSCHR